MRLAKFIEKLDNNEIDDLTPYIEKGNLKELLEIATRGLEIDLLLKRGELDVIKTLIQYNHATEYYDMWKQHSDKSIRQALATKGLYQDEFIKDRHRDVRLASAGNDIDNLIKLYNKSNTERQKVIRVFGQTPNLTKQQIEFILQDKSLSKNQRNAFILKLEALSKIPTPLEKTLSVTQLFTMQNPLWTIGLSANTINDILYTHDRAKKLGWNDQFDNLLDIICANNYQNVRLTCYEYEYKLNKQTN